VKERNFRVADIARLNDADQTMAIAGELSKSTKTVQQDQRIRSPARTQVQVLADVNELKDPRKRTRRSEPLNFSQPTVQALWQAQHLGLGRESRRQSYLLASEFFKRDGINDEPTVPWQQGHFFAWLFGDQFRVLVEPLDNPDAARLPLQPYATASAIGFICCSSCCGRFSFGAFRRRHHAHGSRASRPQRKISLREAINFARDKCLSYFSAPVFPLILLAVCPGARRWPDDEGRMSPRKLGVPFDDSQDDGTRVNSAQEESMEDRCGE